MTGTHERRRHVTRLGNTGDQTPTIADTGGLEPPQLPGHHPPEYRLPGKGHKLGVGDNAARTCLVR